MVVYVVVKLLSVFSEIANLAAYITFPILSKYGKLTYYFIYVGNPCATFTTTSTLEKISTSQLYLLQLMTS